jgi:hypothetical protein
MIRSKDGIEDLPKSDRETQASHHSTHVLNVAICKRSNTWWSKTDESTTDKAVEESEDEDSCGGRVDLEREPDGEGEDAGEEGHNGQGVEGTESI